MATFPRMGSLTKPLHPDSAEDPSVNHSSCLFSLSDLLLAIATFWAVLMIHIEYDSERVRREEGMTV